MNRRSFMTAITGLPFIGLLKGKKEPKLNWKPWNFIQPVYCRCCEDKEILSLVNGRHAEFKIQGAHSIASFDCDRCSALVYVLYDKNGISTGRRDFPSFKIQEHQEHNMQQ